MKIVYFNYLWDLYGAALGSTIKALRLMEALEDLGHTIRLFWRNAAPEALDGRKVEHRERPLKRSLAKILHEPHQLLKNFRYVMEEVKILSHERPDVLVSRLDKYVATAPLLKQIFGLPLVVEADAPVAYEFRRYHPEYWKSPVVLELLEGSVLRSADAIVTVSREIAEYILRYGVSVERVFVVPNAADVRKFNPAVSGAGIRARYDLDNRIVIGFIGSFHYWHGVEALTDLVGWVCTHFERAAFLLVGAGGPMADELRKEVRNRGFHDRVVLPGVIRHDLVPEYVAAMDIVVAPYPRMDFFYYSPVKIYEYMASGKAVVASAQGQILDLIRDGENGYVYDPGDIGMLKRRLAELLENEELRLAMGKQAHETIQRSHTWRHRAERWDEILQRVAGRSV